MQTRILAAGLSLFVLAGVVDSPPTLGEDPAMRPVGDQCPGIFSVEIDAEPGSQMAGLFFSRRTGHATLPINPTCPGVVLNLSPRTLYYIGPVSIDSDGYGILCTRITGNACGGLLQAVVAPSCATTNVVHIPK